MDITEFPSGVIEHLGWYVYRLIDPRDGSTFYVGKGKGNRVFAHMRGEVAATDDDELLSNKLKQIREIRLSGGNNTISTEAGADVGFGRRRNCSTIAAHAALWNLCPAALIRLLPANAPLLGCRQYVFTLGGKGSISFILSGPSHVTSGLHAAWRFPHRQAVSG